MAKIEIPSPLPVSARQEQLARYVADVERLRRSATAANLLLKQENQLSRPASAQLVAILDEMEETLESLEERQMVVSPKIKHAADNLDAIYDLSYDASEHIYKLEALLDVIYRDLVQRPEGHLITLCELAIEQMPKLRFALYGEVMGP